MAARAHVFRQDVQLLTTDIAISIAIAMTGMGREGLR